MVYSIPGWTKKHTDYAVCQKLTRSAMLLWQWLVNAKLEGQVEIIDLKEFNAQVEKEAGKGLDRRTLKDAFNRLIEGNIVEIKRPINSTMAQVFVRRIVELMPPKVKKKVVSRQSKECESESENVQKTGAKPHDGGTGGLAAAAEISLDLARQIEKEIGEEVLQNLETNIEILEKAGIQFDSADAAELLTWEDPQEVIEAVKLFYKRGGHDKIENPEGWMRKCLEKGWHEQKGVFRFADTLTRLAELLGLK